MYDFGVKPNGTNEELDLELNSEENSEQERRMSVFDQSLNRKEYLSVVYDFNVLGFKGPRQMCVVIPGMDDKFNREDYVLRDSNDSLMQSWKKIEENSKLTNPIQNSKSSKFSQIKKSLFQFTSNSNTSNAQSREKS